jgi:hypothetical protein
VHRNRILDAALIAAGVAVVGVGSAGLVGVLSRQAATTSRSAPDAAGLPTIPITAAYINSRPDAHLVYPGATILRTNVHPEGPTIHSLDGSTDDRAYVEVFMATPDSATEVRSWYKEQAASRNYMCIAGIGADYMYQFDVYLSGTREILVVGYIKPEQLRINFGQPVPFNRTIFETDYILNPVRDAVQKPVVPDLCFRPLPSPTP